MIEDSEVTLTMEQEFCVLIEKEGAFLITLDCERVVCVVLEEPGRPVR
jgi:hypothetical protein